MSNLCGALAHKVCKSVASECRRILFSRSQGYVWSRFNFKFCKWSVVDIDRTFQGCHSWFQEIFCLTKEKRYLVFNFDYNMCLWSKSYIFSLRLNFQTIKALYYSYLTFSLLYSAYSFVTQLWSQRCTYIASQYRRTSSSSLPQHSDDQCWIHSLALWHVCISMKCGMNIPYYSSSSPLTITIDAKLFY